VLYGDGHAEFQQNPFCGSKRDNIYTVSGSTTGASTTSKTVRGATRGGQVTACCCRLGNDLR